VRHLSNFNRYFFCRVDFDFKSLLSQISIAFKISSDTQ